jgi:ferredoxin
MQCAAGTTRRSWGDPDIATWIVSLLPVIWKAFTSVRGNSRPKKVLRFFENHTPAANERMLKLEEPVEQNVNNLDGLMGKGAEKLKAQVDKNLCSGCGACAAECPTGAITVGEIAEVDESLCTGCGVCIEACPLEALSMN